MVQSLGGQTRKNRAKIYGSPRFAQRDAADKEWNSRKGRTDQRLETARSKIPNDPDRFSPSNFRDKKCIHISKEGRKEGRISSSFHENSTTLHWIPCRVDTWRYRVGGLCSRKGKCRNRGIWIKNYRVYKVWLDK